MYVCMYVQGAFGGRVEEIKSNVLLSMDDLKKQLSSHSEAMLAAAQEFKTNVCKKNLAFSPLLLSCLLFVLFSFL